MSAGEGAGPPRAGSRERPRDRAWILAAALCLAPALALACLWWRAAVDVPAFDDYDAIVEFLNRWVAADGALAHARLLFAQHIEHRPAILRLAAVATHAALGSADLRLLQAFGVLALVLVGAALLACFRPGEPLRARLPAFAVAALLLFHPQFWSALLWPTCSVANFLSVACAAVAFRGLADATPRSFAVAVLAATAATFSQGNGIAALPLGLVAQPRTAPPWQRRGWLAFALALAAAHVAAFERPFGGWNALENLSDPARIARLAGYVLHFLGSAPGFSQRILAPALGAVAIAGLGALLARGALRRSPALVALLLFLLASAGMNALVRAQQGIAAPLHQDRYRFYACAFLAASWLAWAAELAGSRRERRVVAAALGAALAFCTASFLVYRESLLDLSQRLAAGYERWWLRGDGGLFYPRFASASGMLVRGFERGVLRVPPAWLAQAASPREAPLPEPGSVARFALDAVHLEADALLVVGWAWVGGPQRDPRISLVLRSGERDLVLPAHVVPGVGPAPPGAPAGRIGFHALAATASIPPGDYELGVLFERSDGRWLTLGPRRLRVPARE